MKIKTIEEYLKECNYDKYEDCLGCEYIGCEQYAEGWMHKKYFCKLGKK